MGVGLLTDIVGLGTMVNCAVALTVHTPLPPYSVAVDGPVLWYGGAKLMGDCGPAGLGLLNSLGVMRVYVLAPLPLIIMVFGEPLRAWAQVLGLLSVTPRLGGFTTCTVMFCVSEQPFNVPVRL